MDQVSLSSVVPIQFDHVSFAYTDDKFVVKDVSFSINLGEYVCIIGHNGSGKSTISKLLTGVLKPQLGTIYLYGKAVDKNSADRLRDNVGIVFQNPDNQFIGITVEDDIAFGLENRKFPREQMRAIVKATATQMGVSHLLRYEPHRLSGGQKQRVAIAGILAINPHVILFDESTSMLDPKGKRDIKRFMVALRNRNKAVISVTHDMEEVLACDRVLVMDGGVLVKSGRPDEVFANAQFLREINLDVPFTLGLAQALNAKNPAIPATLNQNALIEAIVACVPSVK